MSEEKKMYKITVQEWTSGDSTDPSGYNPIYEQTVEDLDLQAVIAAVNKPDGKYAYTPLGLMTEEEYKNYNKLEEKELERIRKDVGGALND